MGGTCVIRGCIPKKLLVYASQFSENILDAAGYGWIFGDAKFDWPTLIANKDKEIARLEGLYTDQCREGRRHHLSRTARCSRTRTRLLLLNSGKRVTAEKILIATGNRPDPRDGHQPCHSGRRALHHLRRSLSSEGTAQAHPDRGRRLYRAGIRPYLPWPGQQSLAGLSRRQAAARLRRRHARCAVRLHAASAGWKCCWAANSPRSKSAATACMPKPTRAR